MNATQTQAYEIAVGQSPQAGYLIFGAMLCAILFLWSAWVLIEVYKGMGEKKGLKRFFFAIGRCVVIVILFCILLF